MTVEFSALNGHAYYSLIQNTGKILEKGATWLKEPASIVEKKKTNIFQVWEKCCTQEVIAAIVTYTKIKLVNIQTWMWEGHMSLHP